MFNRDRLKFNPSSIQNMGLYLTIDAGGLGSPFLPGQSGDAIQCRARFSSSGKVIEATWVEPLLFLAVQEPHAG